MKAMELTVRLRQDFAALARVFDPDRAERIMRSHLVDAAPFSVSDKWVDEMAAALRADYEATVVAP
ncbi:MAG: hypothetical protein QOD63_845 [Actinomycetota bacterium]|jgi:hypothetical protein|nr:hypothetical protein [Actinomycetota bacterium]